MANKKGKSAKYTRKIDTKEPIPRLLIVCEGEKTEPNYFRSFRVTNSVIDIEGLGGNPGKIVDKAQELNEEGRYDQVWCVFDRDCWSAEDFNNAIQKANNQGYKVAYSNEAFELWYVLHFEFLNTGIPRKDYRKKLTELLKQEYKKNSENIYENLYDKQSTAIKNATKLLSLYNPLNPGKDNPSTTVHLLVQELNRINSAGKNILL